MNAVLEAIHSRRSVRAYLDRPVEKELLEAIIDAGNWAPTGNNLQRWRFVVVQDKQFIQRLVAAATPTWQGFSDYVLKGTDDYTRAYFTDFWSRCLGWPQQPFEDAIRQAREYPAGVFWEALVIIYVIGTDVYESSMVCENMVLAAQSLGLGICIVGFGQAVTRDPQVVEALEITGNEKIYGPVVFGYPRIVPEPPPKKPPVVKWI